MTIEELWRELEAEPDTGLWRTRRATAQVGQPLLVALEPTNRIRTLLLGATDQALPPRSDWPECHGLELVLLSMGSQPHLGVRLRDPACADVFSALAEDVAVRVSQAVSARQAVVEMLGRLRRWQHFLAAANDGLSLQAQRGLWGELHALHDHLLPSLGAAETASGWMAGRAAHQDFQFPAGAVEVKTTAAKQPQSIRITSERQLDDKGVGALFLHVVVVDERDVPEGDGAPGQSLAGLISRIRADLQAEPAALATFNDRLLERGWLDSKARVYEGRRWTVRDEHTYRVGPGFPRLLESGLPEGVGEASYAISLAACEPFKVPSADLLAILSTLYSTALENPQTS